MPAKLAFSTALSCLFLALSGCGSSDPTEADPDDDEVEAREAADDQSTFYIVTRRDFRKCAFPMCGGYYVKRVNRDETICADGSVAEECYVAEFDMTALKLEDGARLIFDMAVAGGHALMRGAIVPRTYAGARDSAVLVASEGWLGRSGTAPRGKFYRARNAPANCDGTERCPSVQAFRLNTRWSRMLNGVELEHTESSPEAQADAALDMAESPDGILVAGQIEVVAHSQGPIKSLTASEFYTRMLPSEGGKFCGGIAAFPCGERQVCDPDPGMCDVSDVGGTCVLEPEFCPRIYRPVCACSGRTYANDCLRVMARAAKFRDGACK